MSAHSACRDARNRATVVMQNGETAASGARKGQVAVCTAQRAGG